MLILSRRIGDAIMIGDNASIVVLDIIDGHKVKLGIRAPGMNVIRQEIYNPVRKKPIKEDETCCDSGNM